MAITLNILGDIDAGKVVGVIIVLLIWGIAALANLAKKQQPQQVDPNQARRDRAMREQWEAEQRRQAAAALGQMGGGGGPPPPPLPGGRRPQPRQPGPVVPPMRPRQPTQHEQRRDLPPAPVVVMQRPPQQQARRQQPAQRGPVVPPRRTKKAERRLATAQAPAPLPFLEPEPDSEGPARPGVLESEIGAGSTAASPSRRAASAAPMIRLTPQSLRQQFILTEILQPPLALREGQQSSSGPGGR
jgi:hypothetical protein